MQGEVPCHDALPPMVQPCSERVLAIMEHIYMVLRRHGTDRLLANERVLSLLAWDHFYLCSRQSNYKISASGRTW